jgi:hypothetical protein
VSNDEDDKKKFGEIKHGSSMVPRYGGLKVIDVLDRLMIPWLDPHHHLLA